MSFDLQDRGGVEEELGKTISILTNSGIIFEGELTE